MPSYTSNVISQLSSSLTVALLTLVFALGSVAHAQSDDATDLDYKIGPEDVLDISVWKEPELQKEVVVRPDGGISFPLAGHISAAGLTTLELQREMTRRLEEYIPDAVVTVTVVSLKGLRIFVTGKVRSPGQFVVGSYVDVLQALTLAGGLTTFADRNDIRILRRNANGEATFKFNYADVERGRRLEQNIVLQSGDVVVVP